MNDPIIAFPSLLRRGDDEPWLVTLIGEDDQPRVDMEQRRMFIPSADSPVARDSRRHELGHAAWTEPGLMRRLEAAGFPWMLSQGGEDARINTNLANVGIGMEAHVVTRRDLQGVAWRIRYAQRLDVAAILLASTSTPDEPVVRGLVQDRDDGAELIQAVDSVLDEVGLRRQDGLVHSQRTSELVIERLYNLLRTPDPDPESESEQESDQDEGPQPQPWPGSEASDEQEQDDYDEEEDSYNGYQSEVSEDADQNGDLQALMEALAGMEERNDGVKPLEPEMLTGGIPGDENVKHGIKRDPHEVPRYGGWAAMQICEPAHPDRIPARVRGRGRGVNDMGCIPTALHRATSDGRVFRSPRFNAASGTVLIDNSGSMGFSADDLIEIMAQLPAATIADYCSNSAQGQLRILARKGRMASRRVLETSIGGNNGCDGPALRWLATQPGPRFWISDGGITGSEDFAIEGGADECVLVCKAARIIQLRSMPRMQDLLASGKLKLHRRPVLADADMPELFVSREW